MRRVAFDHVLSFILVIGGLIFVVLACLSRYDFSKQAAIQEDWNDLGLVETTIEGDHK